MLSSQINAVTGKKMKAVEIDTYGSSETLKYRDVLDPVPGPGEVVANIYAASVNPVDWKIRNGERQASLHLKFPHVLGVDFSGVIRSLGVGVKDFSIGDEVFGTTAQDQRGCYAEALAVPANQLSLKPKGILHKEAAAIALVGLTALVSLDDVAGLKSGETILVHAGAGGVGSFAVQYAKDVGAKVFATASAGNHEYVKSLELMSSSITAIRISLRLGEFVTWSMKRLVVKYRLRASPS